VQRHPGTSAEELREIVWAYDLDGGPKNLKTIHVHIYQLNKLLIPLGIVVRAPFGAGAGYRIRKSDAMTLGSHQQTVGKSQNHITPKWIIDAIGPIDLDPCAADPRPWDCATTNWTMYGFSREWFGMVYVNPPFNRYEVGSSPSTATASRCCTPELKRNGFCRSGGARPASCSWLRANFSFRARGEGGAEAASFFGNRT
jgi:hypothetical protein